jgi:hypothetical protein
VDDEECDDIDECSFQSVWPVTWILWPTCRSRSFPPSSFQLIGEPADADALVAGDAAVVPTLLLPLVPVVPAVVVVGFVALPPVVVAPLAVVVLERELLAFSSIRALFSMNVPSLPRARQPVTVTSRAPSLWAARSDDVVVVCGELVV